MPARTFLLLIAVFAAETWPVTVAYRLLRFAVRSPDAAGSAIAVGRPLIAVCAALIVVWLAQTQKLTRKRLILLPTAAGAAMATTLLALATSYEQGTSKLVFLESLFGGALYAGPVGALVGGLLGASVLGSQIAFERLRCNQYRARGLGVFAASLLAHAVIWWQLSGILDN